MDVSGRLSVHMCLNSIRKGVCHTVEHACLVETPNRKDLAEVKTLGDSWVIRWLERDAERDGEAEEGPCIGSCCPRR